MKAVCSSSRSALLVLIICFAGMFGLSLERAECSPAALDSVDSEMSARALLFFKQTKCFQGAFQGIKTNGLWTWGNFTLNRNLEIIQLSVESENVPISPGVPLKGLPFPTGKILSRYSLWVSALDYDDRVKAAGIYETELFSSASIIHVVLIPGKVPKLVPYVPDPTILPIPGSPGAGTNSLEIKLSDGSVFWYGHQVDASGRIADGFLVFVDPFGPPQTYEIIDPRTGDVLSIGIIGPNERPVLVEEKKINIVDFGNVTEAYFPRPGEGRGNGRGGENIDSVYFGEQTYNSVVFAPTAQPPTPGSIKSIPAKVYITDLEQEGGLIVLTSDIDANIVVKEWKEDGDMPLLHMDPVATGFDSKLMYTDVSVLGKVIVCITSPHTNSLFWIKFYRYRDDPT